jgi:alpha-ketoglutarate-dependent taurine dioxygenase
MLENLFDFLQPLCRNRIRQSRQSNGKMCNSAMIKKSKGLRTLMAASDWLDVLCEEGFYAGNLGPLTAVDLLQLARQLSTLGNNLAPGPVLEVQRVPGSEYVTLTRGRVPFHNDGVYKPFPPRYLVLYCQSPGSRGGDTLLARGDKLAGGLDRNTRALLRRLSVRTSLAGFSAKRPLLFKHPRDGSRVIFFGDPGLAESYWLEAERETDINAAIEAIRSIVGDVKMLCHRQRWKQHDLLVLDNYKVLHARTAYRGDRVLKRVEVGVVT